MSDLAIEQDPVADLTAALMADETTGDEAADAPPADEADNGDQPGQFKSLDDAVRAYNELRSAYNRRDQEVSEKRQLEERLAQYEQAIAAFQQQQAAAQVPSDAGTIDTLIEQHGYQAVADWARQNNRPDVYEYVNEQWYEESPRAQQRYERMLDTLQQQVLLRQQIMPQMLAQDWATVAREYPEMNQLGPQMQQAAQEVHQLIGPALTSDNPQQRQEALRYLYWKARSLAAAAQPSAAHAAAPAAPQPVPHVATPGASAHNNQQPQEQYDPLGILDVFDAEVERQQNLRAGLG